MSDAQIDAKFIDLATRVLSTAQAHRLLEMLWNVERLDGLSPLLQATVAAPN